MSQSCGTCAFFCALTDQCKRHAPRCRMPYMSTEPVAYWPPVSPSEDWCGDWRLGEPELPLEAPHG